MKNIKSEYTNLIQNDLPDLWDRIDAAISIENQVICEEDNNKAIDINDNAVGVKRAENVTENITENIAENVSANGKLKPKKKGYVRFVAPLSMAAMLFLSFGIYMIMNGGNKASESTVAMNSAASCDYAESTATYDYAEADACEEVAEDSEALYEDVTAEDYVKSESFEDSVSAEYAKSESFEDSASAEFVESEMSEKSASAEYVGAENAENFGAHTNSETSKIYADSEASGFITFAKNEDFIQLETDEGTIIDMFVPSELKEEVSLAVELSKKVTIRYEELYKDEIDSFPKAYQEVKYKIVEIVGEK